VFNFETVSLFSRKRDSTKESEKLKERAREELKRYECFNTLLNGKEEMFQKCKDIILQDVLNATRTNTRINRDYLLGFQDALDIVLLDLERYREAIKQLS
jgi:hypothetical protein